MYPGCRNLFSDIDGEMAGQNEIILVPANKIICANLVKALKII